MRFKAGDRVEVHFVDIDKWLKGMVVAETDSLTYIVWVETQLVSQERTVTGNMLHIPTEYLRLVQ